MRLRAMASALPRSLGASTSGRCAGTGYVSVRAPMRSSPRCNESYLAAHPAAARASMRATSSSVEAIVLRRPDDWHLHVRDGAVLADVVPATAAVFGRAIIMPNLIPPVTDVAAALAYRERILEGLAQGWASHANQAAAAPDSGLPCPCGAPPAFRPRMTLYLTDSTSPDEISRAAASEHVVACKLYPAGATTNSDSGVTDWRKALAALRAMAQHDIPLLVHGEVTAPEVDFFDRERVFVEQVLRPLRDQLPELRVVLEHVTTAEAAAYVEEVHRAQAGQPGASTRPLLGATLTPQHLLWNRNALFAGGVRPHAFCLPVLKREAHRRALVEAATRGPAHRAFFLGTDSAPHARGRKESACGCAGVYSAPVALPLYAVAFERAGALEQLEAFASLNGPAFYGVPPSEERVRLVKRAWKVPEKLRYGDEDIVPMWAGDVCPWAVEEL